MSDQGEQWGVPTIHTWLLLPKAPLSKGTFLGTGEHQCYHSDRLGSSPKRTGQWHSALLYEPDSFLDQCGIWCKRMREFALALKKNLKPQSVCKSPPCHLYPITATSHYYRGCLCDFMYCWHSLLCPKDFAHSFFMTGSFPVLHF